jgi:Spy/CpxP family protein refolding chaperone
MRRQVWLVLGGLAVVLLAVQMVLAQEAPPPPGPGSGPTTREGRGMRGQMGTRMVDELIKEMGVNEETGTKVRALFDEFRQATRNWQQANGPKLRDLFEQLRTAREAKDEAKVKQLTEQIRTLQHERLAIRDNLVKQLGEILTPEQLEKAKDVVIEWRMRLRFIMREVTLTDEQKAKLAAIVKDWKEDVDEGLIPERRGANFRALVEKVITEVILTDAQRKALAAMTGEEPLLQKISKLDLTDAQKAQVEALRTGLERRRPTGGPRSRPAGAPRRGGPAGEQGPGPGPGGGGE